MKIFKTKFTVLLFSIIMYSSCSTDDDCITGQGAITTETIELSSFSGVISSGSDTVIISQAATQEVTVTGHPNIINRLKRSVGNGIWKAELEDGCYKNSDLTINIKVPNMNYIKLAGSGSAMINDFINQQDLKIIIEGSGSVELNENQGTHNLDITIEGSGNVTGLGNFEDLENLDIGIFGSGYFDGFQIETNACKIFTEGSGYCNVYVQDFLDVTIEGSTEINYKGNPAITSDIEGSGTINNAN